MSEINWTLALVFPPHCVLCRARGSGLCDLCLSTLCPAPDLGPPPGLRSCDSLLRYDDATRDVVAALKFHNHRDAVRTLGAAMAMLVGRHRLDVVTWAPTSSERRSRRGYDQSELLARSVARSLHRPCRAMLRRLSGPAQTGRDRAHRANGPRFVAMRPSDPANHGAVLVVDDVRTTGSTLTAAAAALSPRDPTALHARTTLHGLTLAVVP